ncbi:MAG: MFS transporter [Clostridiales bacterium]|nr:MFS transporter [Clostridiales bacterium]
MQFKLLNYYKVLSKVATCLVGSFVPLIIYNTTGSLIYAVLYMMLNNVFRLLTGLVLRKQIQKRPEVFLILRALMLGGFCVSLALIPQLFLIGSLLASLFGGIDASFQMVAEETLFNYASSKSMDSKKIAATRVFEGLGYFAGLLIGGLILDINKTVVYIMCIVLYIISILPLFYLYIKNRKNSAFNKEYVSNMIEQVSKSDKKVSKIRYIVIAIMVCYFAIYMSYCISDSIYYVFNLATIVEGAISYSFASVFIIIFRVSFVIGNVVVSYIDKKFDLLNVVRLSCVIISIAFVCMCFVRNVFVLYVAFAAFGLFYSFICCFVLQRFIQKSRIIGQSNNAFMVREVAGSTSLILSYAVLLLLIVLDISMFYFFLIAAAMLIITSFVIPALEEKTRRLLVDFVEDNEITSNQYLSDSE